MSASTRERLSSPPSRPSQANGEHRPAQASAEAMLEAMPHRAALLDGEGRVIAANREWLQPLDWEASEAAASHPVGAHYLADLSPVDPGDEVGAFVAGVLEVLDKRRPHFAYELPREGPRGRSWFSIRVSALASPGRELLALVTEEDVTARRRAQADLLASEHQLRTIITGAPIVLFSIDLDGRLSLFDGLGAAGLGVSPERVVGRSVFEVFAHVPQLLGAVRRAMSGETTVTSAPIGRMTFELRCSPAFTSEDRVAGVVGIATDITERARIERLKNEFVSIVSHELRTPLTSIRGSLGLLDGGVAGDLEARTRQLVKIALSNTERLIRLVNDILDLDKMETGRLELRSESLDPVDLADAAIAEISGFAEESGVALVRKFEPAGSVEGDRDRLLQVLNNLLSNAIKFSKPGDTVTLELAEDETGRVRFSVCDEGPGIADEQLPKLFRKFSQLDESDARSTGGSGLGLAISKAIVEAHGGEIGVASQPGVGSRFHFQLGAGPASRPQRRIRSESSPFRRVRRPRTGDERRDQLFEFVDHAVVLLGPAPDEAERMRARELQRRATLLARRRGLPVTLRSGLVRVSTALANLAASSSLAHDREHQRALEDALRALEHEASAGL